MSSTREIEVHHLTRVEGHGDIRIEVRDGRLVEARWAVVETPRFFEAMLRGMSHEMAPVLTARICGICSIGHTLASLRAVERAMQIPVPETARLLRLLAKHGETLQSHSLHVFFLAAPDFLNAHSVIPLLDSHPEVAGIAVRLKGLGNRICDEIAGRTTHPVRLVPGGVTRAPARKELEALGKEIQERMTDIEAGLAFFGTLSLPDFERETEFVSLKGEGAYPWIGGTLVSSDGVQKPEEDYLAMTQEYREPFTTSKWTRLSRESFAVGALARFNNNHALLQEKARQAAAALGLTPVSHNPYMNNAAQLVECYHVMLESLEIVRRLLEADLGRVREPYEVRAGAAVGAVEVPRGILYHHYEIDGKGALARADYVIPTTQNNANIHLDLGALARQQVARGAADAEIRRLSEMLVRAYDPCISCSVH